MNFFELGGGFARNQYDNQYMKLYTRPALKATEGTEYDEKVFQRYA